MLQVHLLVDLWIIDSLYWLVKRSNLRRKRKTLLDNSSGPRCTVASDRGSSRARGRCRRAFRNIAGARDWWRLRGSRRTRSQSWRNVRAACDRIRQMSPVSRAGGGTRRGTPRCDSTRGRLPVVPPLCAWTTSNNKKKKNQQHYTNSPLHSGEGTWHTTGLRQVYAAVGGLIQFATQRHL